MASQMVEKELTQSKPLLSDRWGSPKSSAKLDLLRKEGTPKARRCKPSLSVQEKQVCIYTHAQVCMTINYAHAMYVCDHLIIVNVEA